MRKKMFSTIAGAVLLLSLTAASSYSAVCCGTSQATNSSTGGTVTAAGAGFLYETGTKALVAGSRSVTLTCDAALTTWDGTTARTFIIPGTPDKDGTLAAALTALASGKKVQFCLSTADLPVSGTTKGQVKLLHVLDDNI